jgi:hypothetical protein
MERVIRGASHEGMLGVILYERIVWRLQTEMIDAKVSGTFNLLETKRFLNTI